MKIQLSDLAKDILDFIKPIISPIIDLFPRDTDIELTSA